MRPARSTRSTESARACSGWITTAASPTSIAEQQVLLGRVLGTRSSDVPRHHHLGAGPPALRPRHSAGPSAGRRTRGCPSSRSFGTRAALRSRCGSILRPTGCSSCSSNLPPSSPTSSSTRSATSTSPATTTGGSRCSTPARREHLQRIGREPVDLLGRNVWEAIPGAGRIPLSVGGVPGRGRGSRRSSSRRSSRRSSAGSRSGSRRCRTGSSRRPAM